MTHTAREKTKLLTRVRRMRGQIEAIERALKAEAGCGQVLHLIAGVRGAMAGLMAEVVEDTSGRTWSSRRRIRARWTWRLPNSCSTSSAPT